MKTGMQARMTAAIPRALRRLRGASSGLLAMLVGVLVYLQAYVFPGMIPP